LLPAFFDANRLHGPKVRKPRFSREGTNVTIESLGIDTAGPYSDEGWIYQALANIPQFDGQYPVIGSWIIEDEAAGMGIREDSSPVTQNMSRFVPHWF
jgi:glutathionylspermidine synthase